MSWPMHKLFLAAAALLILGNGCATRNEMKMNRAELIAKLEHEKMNRAELIAKLEHEMKSNTTWLRIHAVEGLLDNGESGGIVELFKPEADTAPAPYRIGVWRVLARATNGTERSGYVERIRAVMRDAKATDRISASESLGKLNAASREDREFITQWLTTADDATAPFARWLLVLSSNPSERENDETTLAQLLSSSDAVARLRAAFALGRLKDLSANSIAKFQKQLKIEPADSIARVYLITALMLHVKDTAAITELEKQMLPYLHGKANEQLEVGIVTGLRGKSEGIKLLTPLLTNSEPDARIGAANGLLRLIK